MLIQPLLEKLTQLHLSAVRAGLEEQLQTPHYAELSFEDRLGLLIDLECTRRADNRLKRRLKAARLQLPATIESLDLSPRRGLERRFVLELAQGEWIRHYLNIIILGPTGTGKTFLACALANSACRHDFSVRYERTARFLHQLKLAHADGSYPELLNKLTRVQLLVFDDWLRDSLTPSQSQDLLEILDDRYDRLSTMVVTQVPVLDWHARFPDPTIGDAVLDRLIHNAYRIKYKRRSRLVKKSRSQKSYS
jgi:DNA replication protein DnaC